MVLHHGWRLTLALLAVLLTVVAASASASAATVGALPDTPVPCFHNPVALSSDSGVIAAAGKLTSFLFRSLDLRGQANLLVLRATGAPNQFTVLDQVTATDTGPYGSLLTVPVPSPIPVQAGDRIGIFTATSNFPCEALGGGTPYYYNQTTPQSAPATGGTYTFTGVTTGFIMNLAATFVPQPSLSTVVSGSVAQGGAVTDTATLARGASPTGTMAFKAYGPDDAFCTGPVVFTDSQAVNGNGSYTSNPFTPPAPGTYRFIASYSGDSNNLPVSGACNDAGEAVAITSAPNTGTPAPEPTAPAPAPAAPAPAPPVGGTVAPKPACAKVPLLIGRTFHGALLLLKRANCRHLTVKHTGHARKGPSKVKTQSPARNSSIARGRALTLTLG